MSRVKVNFKGKRARRMMETAQKRGLDRTMSEAVVHAKNNHAWRNRTGTLEGSIAVHQFAEQTRSGFRGVWGSQDVRYALIHEFGGTITPKESPALIFQVGGDWVRTQRVRIPARPYLRPAADATYGELAANIRREWDKLKAG